MGRPVSITLPNGRYWPKKGDAAKHFQDMLRRHQIGGRVSDAADHSDLSALVQVYDSVLTAGEATKAGVGISHFEKHPDVDHPGNTACFFVVRTDGTSIDFSLGRALDVAGRVRQG